MLPQLQNKFDQLESISTELISRMEALDHSKLNRAIKKNKWSKAQHLEHIILVEKASVSYISKKIKYSDNAKNTGIKNVWRSSLIKLFFAMPFIKIKAPAIVADVPNESSIESIKMKWSEERKNLYKQLSLIDEQLVSKELFKHPIAGKMNIIQAMDFLKGHLNHHKKQILN